MHVIVKSTLLSHPNVKKTTRVPLETGATVQTLLQVPGITTEAHLFIINGRVSQLSDPLQDGDQVGIFPALVGG
ncbi:MAG: MoaD/ThiS family protein [Clostridiales bacterium]|jgi:molybdopterin converting factor small subunit|nr:MoaD/ThiS family protein [Clostridiales bacterium]